MLRQLLSFVFLISGVGDSESGGFVNTHNVPVATSETFPAGETEPDYVKDRSKKFQNPLSGQEEYGSILTLNISNGVRKNKEVSVVEKTLYFWDF